MKVFVTAKPRSKEDKLVELAPRNLVVTVKALPVDGEANRAIIKLLANHYSVAPSLVVLQKGSTGKKKIFEVPD